MKFLLLFTLVASIRTEADPAFAYGFGLGGHVLPYHHPITYTTPYVHHTPLVYLTPTGCQNVAGHVVPCHLGATVATVEAEAEPVEAVERKKREAEAEAEPEADAEADPWVFYTTHGYWPHGYSHYAPHSYSYAPFTYASHYGHYGLGHYGYYGKREAEAEPEADPEADPYLLYGFAPYGGYGGYYGYGYHHALPYFLGHHGHCRNNQGAAVPCAAGR